MPAEILRSEIEKLKAHYEEASYLNGDLLLEAKALESLLSGGPVMPIKMSTWYDILQNVQKIVYEFHSNMNLNEAEALHAHLFKFLQPVAEEFIEFQKVMDVEIEHSAYIFALDLGSWLAHENNGTDKVLSFIKGEIPRYPIKISTPIIGKELDSLRSGFINQIVEPNENGEFNENLLTDIANGGLICKKIELIFDNRVAIEIKKTSLTLLNRINTAKAISGLEFERKDGNIFKKLFSLFPKK